MTPEQKSLVQTTWQSVALISEQAAELFYGRLFQIDPSLKSLFKGDMTEQGKKLMQMLAAAVAGLDNLDELTPAVAALGLRHNEYGVQEPHYDSVGEALLWTLEQGLGDAFTDDVAAAWETVYVTLATVMKAAAASPTGSVG